MRLPAQMFLGLTDASRLRVVDCPSGNEFNMPPLAADSIELADKPALYNKKSHENSWDLISGGSSGVRTPDTLIKSQVLCQLS